jgi:signal transduction histidine kinase
LLLLEKGETKLKLNPEVVNLKDLCQSASDTVHPQARSKSIKIDNAVESCELIADRMRVEQVLINLLSNAVKFSERGGSVSIVSERSDEFVTISVNDAGKGIDADECPHLFEKFFQSRNAASGEGFGLGLAIAKMIVEEHDGKIGVRSEVGKGSTFWFSLPLEC